jgi:2,4-dienoyl-CoA reductase-like NADH-dependent reductase (Old Yellow Enzyme family)
MNLELLFTPIQVGADSSKNRFVFSPIGTNFETEEGYASDVTIRHYEERAKGGAGIIIIERSSVYPMEPPSLNPGIWKDEFIDGLTELSGSIQNHGALALIQLWHPGPKARSPDREEAVSASEIPIRDFKPRMLETEEVYGLIDDFVEGGVRASKAGFDGVELHSAHFYLLSAFLSPYTNNREDEFGGSTENRSKMVCDVVKGIKDRAGQGFAVYCRINSVEKLEGGVSLEEGKKISKLLVSAGADAIDVSAYALPLSQTYKGMGIRFGSVGGRDDPKGSFVPYAEGIKSAVDVPVIAVSKLDDPVYAHSVLEEGKADLIAIGRGLLADPYLPEKTREGRIEEINKCTYCGVCHIKQQRGEPISCPINPALGR